MIIPMYKSKGSSFMEKAMPHGRAYPKVEERTSRIRIIRLYPTALYQHEREESLVVCQQCL